MPRRSRGPPAATPGPTYADVWGTIDGVRGTVGRILQGLGREVCVTLRHRGVIVAEDLLNLIEGTATVHQEAGIHVPEVVNPKMRQASLSPQTIPHLMYFDHCLPVM